MTMRWFGKSWGAPVNSTCPQAPVPVGERCCHCDEAISANDTGVIFANGPVAHRNCFFRMSFGSKAHHEKQCSCYVPGSTCTDPPDMTRREAADDLAHSMGYKQTIN